MLFRSVAHLVVGDALINFVMLLSFLKLKVLKTNLSKMNGNTYHSRTTFTAKTEGWRTLYALAPWTTSKLAMVKTIHIS